MGFKFKDRVCVIEINDVKYSVTFQKALFDRLNEAKELFGSVKNCDRKDISKVCSVFDKAIDGILGGGSALTIFAGRFENLMERYAVLQYIYDELMTFFNEIAEEKDVCPKAESDRS